ncbi:MAG TPA: hypothetical protein VIL74_21110 [Pyrinomonadaceae bacterium]|jgi:hypothetical protein
MAPRVDAVRQNQEIPKPKTEEPKTVRQETKPVNFMPPTDKDLFLRQNNLGADALRVGLFARFDAGGATRTAADPGKVNDAVNAIKESLSEGFTDWDVTHGDLQKIQNTFRGLNAEEANQVFARLSDGDVQKWVDELGGLNGSYSREEKQRLFGELAGKLSGANLGRIARALGDDGFDAGDLGRAAAQNASSQAKVDFVRGLAGAVERSDGASEAVAEVVSGLANDPAALDRALGALSDTQLKKLMENISVNGISSPMGGGYTIEYKGELLAKMLNAVARSNSAEVKARVFDAAALQLKSIEDAPGFIPGTAIIGKAAAAAGIRDALTGVLNSDTVGIMTNLEHDARNGEGVAAYVKSMLDAGKTAELGTFVARLSKGNDLRGNPIDRFGAQVPGTDGRPHYRNAQVLGYFAGALFAGAKQISGDRTKQADMLKNIFGTIAGATGAANPASGVVSSVLNGLTQAIVNEVTDGLNKGTMDMEEALEKLLFPRDAATGELYEGAAEADFDSAFGRVVLKNQ